MRIKGLAKIKKQLIKMRSDLENKIDNVSNRCGTIEGDRVYDRLDSAWVVIDSAIDELNCMDDI